MESPANNVLVLGASGMLGSMVTDYFINKTGNNIGFTYNNPAKGSYLKEKLNAPSFMYNAKDYIPGTFNNLFKEFEPDYIINCIGIINKYCNTSESEQIANAVSVNSLFPHRLKAWIKENNLKARVIQIATDCVFSGSKGSYTETCPHDATDVYGKSKSLGEVSDPDFLNLRCSIIGPELYSKLSLLEWFLSHEDGQSVSGFTHHLWNGLTTLQFAQYCHKIIDEDLFHNLCSSGSNHHIILNETVSKFQLLNIINEVFNRKIEILETKNEGVPINRTLSSVYQPVRQNPMKEVISDLLDYINDSKLYQDY